MTFKRRLVNGQNFIIKGRQYVCLETHVYLQTRVDGEDSDIDAGSSYYIIRDIKTGHLHRVGFKKIIDKDDAKEITFVR
jgi:hypothetical protein